MKYLLFFLMAFAPCLCKAYEVQYERLDSIKVVGLLDGARRLPDGTNDVIYFARKLKGLPYVAHTLEVNKTEKLVVNLRQLDCTTYVENVMALTLCVRQKKYTFKAFCDNLCRMRYRSESQPHYVSRLHYFTDWIDDNTRKGLCREVQEPNPPFVSVQKINSHTHILIKVRPNFYNCLAYVFRYTIFIPTFIKNRLSMFNYKHKNLPYQIWYGR